MPSNIKSFAEFDTRLRDAIHDMKAIVAQYPGDRELHSIQLQLDALFQWTRGGVAPAQSQKDQLNFGLLASKYLDDIDKRLANELYELASYVIFW